ncbi:MAG: VWA domain-containing protein [Sandaracinaceae bacterium]
MDQVLIEFVHAGRRAGLRISTSESMDAQRAAGLVGFSERAALRGALAATLCKRIQDQATFDRVFERFFRIDEPEDTEAVSKDASESESPGQLASAGAGGGGLAAAMEGGAELAERIEGALREAGVTRIQSPMQVGLFALRTLEALGMPEMERELAETPLEPEVRRQASGRLEALRRRVRGRVRQELERRNPDRLARGRAERLEDAPLRQLDPSERKQVRREVERLAEALRDRMERRRRRSRRGVLDVRATVRSSLRTGGVPFAPVYRRRRRDRPKLVVLCDISDSVRTAAQFLLVLVHTMQSAFSRTRSFVFVQDVAEVTQMFEQNDLDASLAIVGRPGAMEIGASSDYGRTLGTLFDAHLDAFDRRTTLLVLGDARSNRLDPNVRALRAIHRRAARVVWLNPEPRNAWGFGDSEMRAYTPYCSLLAPVRTLAELREATRRLVRVVSRG